MSRRIVLTGSEGYLGSVLGPLLVRSGFDVLGIDTGYFRDCRFQPGGDVPTLRADVRDLGPDALAGADTVVHLAALSNDAVSRLDPRFTHEINADATVRLAELARAAGVRRFVLSASCIVYGVAGSTPADENAPVDPRTAYARSKVDAERRLLALAADGFSPVSLRNGTIYGPSPHIRLDTVFNDFLAAGVALGRVVVRGDGSESRPVVDVRDVARGFVEAIVCEPERVHAQVVNLGSDHLNQRIGELAELAAALTGAEVEVLGTPDADRRDYVVDFTRCARLFPRLFFMSTAQAGRDLVRQLRATGFDRAAYESGRFRRLDHLQRLLREGRIDGSLRWTETLAGV